MFEYTLLQSYDKDYLSLLVTNKAKEGWKLVDNVVVTLDSYGKLTYTQAMTYRKEDV